MIYGIYNRGNTCYAAAVIQCLCRILECIPTDIVDLDSIPRIASDAQEYYESLVDKIRPLRSMISSTLPDNISVSVILDPQLVNIVDAGPMICIRVEGTFMLQEKEYISVIGRKYRLIAAVSLSNSHYTAFVEERGLWYYCDDSNVRVVDVKTFANLYLLFYKYVPNPNVSNQGLH